MNILFAPLLTDVAVDGPRWCVATTHKHLPLLVFDIHEVSVSSLVNVVLPIILMVKSHSLLSSMSQFVSITSTAFGYHCLPFNRGDYHLDLMRNLRKELRNQFYAYEPQELAFNEEVYEPCIQVKLT